MTRAIPFIPRTAISSDGPSFTLQGDQLRVTVGDPDAPYGIDLVKLEFLPIEGEQYAYAMAMTPDEALEVASMLTTAMQFYLLQQRQYQRDIVRPRRKVAAQRAAQRAPK